MDFLKRAIIPLTFIMLAILALANGWIWSGILAASVVLLGLYDWSQRGEAITRNFPVAGRIRWLFYRLRPYLRAYIVEDDLHGTPYSFEARNLVHARAHSQSGTHPFGTERDLDAADYHWVGHSIMPHPEPETNPRVTVGNSQTGKPYCASILTSLIHDGSAVGCSGSVVKRAA